MWFKFLAWLALLQLRVLDGATSKELGKIYGGHSVLIKEFPFLVSLRRGNTFKCGGTLITPDCVLTAAHCLERRHWNVQDLYVHAQLQRLGDTAATPHVRQAWFASVSPAYCARSFDSDIAVIRLRRPFDISENVSAIRINYNDLPQHANLTILGWGMTGDTADPNQTLQTSEVQLMPQDECAYRLRQFQPITKNMFCALGRNNSDACNGDSGGPVLYAGRVVGIVSWGYGCGKGYPGVYTRLSSSSMSWFLKNSVENFC